ncbi:MAG: hypothetical protein MUF61_02670 [archaeon]|jgi:hypothetical protein|nr:hypothetical protein [archaeon]
MRDIGDLIKDNPFILSADFQRRFPKIIDIVMYLDEAAIASRRKTGRYEVFDRLGVDCLDGYIALLGQDDEEALKVYRNVRAIIENGDSADRQCITG